MSFEQDIIKEIFNQQLKSEHEPLTQEEEKNAEKLFLDFYRASIANLQQNETNPKIFFEFLSEPGAVVLVQQPSAPKYTRFVIQHLLKEFQDVDSRASLMSHMINICSLMQEFTFLPSEARQELCIAGLDEILTNTSSPFHREKTIQKQAVAQVSSILSTTYLSRVKGDRLENLKKALEYNQTSLKILDPEFDYDFYCTLLNNQSIIHKRMKNFSSALDAFDQLLKYRTKEKSPLEWALSNVNMGNLYIDEEYLKTTDPIENYKRSIHCYRNALTVLKQDVNPIQWSICMMSLGYALYTSAANDLKILLESRDCLNSALEKITKEKRGEFALIHYHLAHCYWKLFLCDANKDHLASSLNSIELSNGIKENPKLVLLKKVIQSQ